jgi:hypothetical protein
MPTFYRRENLRSQLLTLPFHRTSSRNPQHTTVTSVFMTKAVLVPHKFSIRRGIAHETGLCFSCALHAGIESNSNTLSSSRTVRAFYPLGKIPEPTRQNTGCTPELTWPRWRRENPDSAGFEIRSFWPATCQYSLIQDCRRFRIKSERYINTGLICFRSSITGRNQFLPATNSLLKYPRVNLTRLNWTGAALRSP